MAANTVTASRTAAAPAITAAPIFIAAMARTGNVLEAPGGRVETGIAGDNQVTHCEEGAVTIGFTVMGAGAVIGFGIGTGIEGCFAASAAGTAFCIGIGFGMAICGAGLSAVISTIWRPLSAIGGFLSKGRDAGSELLRSL